MDKNNEEEPNQEMDPASSENLRKSDESESGSAGKGKNDPELTGPESKIENSFTNTDMEVHHHSQLGHKNKSWKEYLLEGLMIFIAVMLGFIAENIREGITNREHVRELVSQLVRDLKNDTLELNKTYRAETKIVNANDTLVDLLQHPLDMENAGRLLPLITRSHSLWLFHPSAGAIAAIKNELHLKQFSSSNMIGLIADYEKHIDLIRTVQDITLQYQRTYLDPFLVAHFTGAGLDAAFKRSPGEKVEVRNLSPEDLVRLGSGMQLIRINTNELLSDNRTLFTDAMILLKYVREQYNPDDR